MVSNYCHCGCKHMCAAEAIDYVFIETRKNAANIHNWLKMAIKMILEMA